MYLSTFVVIPFFVARLLLRALRNAAFPIALNTSGHELHANNAESSLVYERKVRDKCRARGVIGAHLDASPEKRSHK